MDSEKPAHSRFPDPRDFGDIVAVGGDLSPAFLLDAYEHGIFPWPMEGTPHLPWFCPEIRAVLFIEELHLPRSLTKAKKRSHLRFTVDQDFRAVIHHCRMSPRPGQAGTWITQEIEDAYVHLHDLGRAHSVEAWNGERLVGGVYGVDGGGVFAAESMFFLEENASKLALLHLISHLHNRGLKWLDIQMLTPHLERMGAREIEREDFLELLEETQKLKLDLFPRSVQASR